MRNSLANLLVIVALAACSNESPDSAAPTIEQLRNGTVEVSGKRYEGCALQGL